MKIVTCVSEIKNGTITNEIRNSNHRRPNSDRTISQCQFPIFIFMYCHSYHFCFFNFSKSVSWCIKYCFLSGDTV